MVVQQKRHLCLLPFLPPATAKVMEVVFAGSDVVPVVADPGQAVLSALSTSLYMLAPFLSPHELKALSLASASVLPLVTPSWRRLVRAEELEQELRRLPFECHFPLAPFGPKALEEVLRVLRTLHLMRRRELVGHGAGMVPTDVEPWRFKSWAELMTLVAAARLAKRHAQNEGKPALLLAGVLRQAPEQVLEGPLLTASMGLEWVEGPAADPLQLGVHLAIAADRPTKLELELGSGGWSPWSQTWTLSDRTLEAQAAVAAALPGNSVALVSRLPLVPSGGVEATVDAQASEADGAAALSSALAEAGTNGVRVVVCVGELRWGKEAPVWCPPEVRKVAVRGTL